MDISVIIPLLNESDSLSELHSSLKKVMTSSKKYHVHDEKNKFKIGDLVRITESRPRSKLKRWEVLT